MSSKVKPPAKPVAKLGPKPAMNPAMSVEVRPGTRHPPLDRALFVFDDRLRELEELLYGHIINAIDFNALDMLEQHASWLIDQHHPDLGELSLDLSKAMVSRGLERAVDDQARYCSNVPFGISKEEAKAAAFDENCPFCVAEAEAADRAAAAPPAGHGEEEDCPLCDSMVRAWRAEHAEALAKRGVKVPAHS